MIVSLDVSSAPILLYLEDDSPHQSRPSCVRFLR